MTDDVFNFDSDEQVQDLLQKINYGSDSQEVLSALDKARQLPAEARRYIADRLEGQVGDMPTVSDRNRKEALVEALRLKKSAAQLQAARAAGDTLTLAALEQELGVFSGSFAGSEVVAFVFDNKGDEACRFIKTFAEETAKLSDEEYGLMENTLLVQVRVLERMFDVSTAPPAPRPNPFRKNMPGM